MVTILSIYICYGNRIDGIFPVMKPTAPDIAHSDAPVFLVALAFAAIYVIWGSTYLAIRIAIETIPPLLMAGARFALAGAILYACVREPTKPAPSLRDWGYAAVVGGLMLAGGNGLVTLAERTVPSGIAAVVIATVPLWMTALSAWPFRTARPGASAWAGVAIGLTGVVLLVAPWRGPETGGAGIEPYGATLLVLAALSWSVGSLLTRARPGRQSPLRFAAMQMIAGGAWMLGAAVVRGEPAAFDPSRVSRESWAAFAYLVTFGSIVALGAYVWLMRVRSAAAVSTYAFVNPVVAVGLGWWLAGEAIDGRTLVATGAIVGAVVLLQAPKKPARGRARIGGDVGRPREVTS